MWFVKLSFPFQVLEYETIHIHLATKVETLSASNGFITTKTQTPNLTTTLYYGEHFHIAQTRTRIPTPYFCIVKESESVSVSESGSVVKPRIWTILILSGRIDFTLALTDE